MRFLGDFPLRFFLEEMDWRVAEFNVISREVVESNGEDQLIRLLVSFHVSVPLSR